MPKLPAAAGGAATLPLFLMWNESRRYNVGLLRRRIALAGHGYALQLEHDPVRRKPSQKTTRMVRGRVRPLRHRNRAGLSTAEEIRLADFLPRTLSARGPVCAAHARSQDQRRSPLV